MREWIIFAAIQVVALIMVIIFIRMDYKKQHPPKLPPCDTCSHLEQKWYGWYYCKKMREKGTFSFRVPPVFCDSYESRKN